VTAPAPAPAPSPPPAPTPAPPAVQTLTVIRCPRCGTKAHQNGRQGTVVYFKCPKREVCGHTFRGMLSDPLRAFFPTLGK